MAKEKLDIVEVESLHVILSLAQINNFYEAEILITLKVYSIIVLLS